MGTSKRIKYGGTQDPDICTYTYIKAESRRRTSPGRGKEKQTQHEACKASTQKETEGGSSCSSGGKSLGSRASGSSSGCEVTLGDVVTQAFFSYKGT